MGCGNDAAPADESTLSPVSSIAYVVPASGDALFSGYRKLERFLERLPVEAYELTNVLVENHWSPEAIPEELVKRFILRPLDVQAMLWTQVDFGLRPLEMANGEQQQVCRMLGHVPYQGSRLLWYVRPTPDFRFRLRGNVGKQAAKLGTLVEGKDVAPFEAMLAGELDRLRDALHTSLPQVGEYNERIRTVIDRTLRTF